MVEGWALTDDGKAIQRRFQFKTFRAAWGFMSQAALYAEKINHHPEWSNVYGTVDVRLTTHSTGGLTELDEKMALMMNRIAEGSIAAS